MKQYDIAAYIWPSYHYEPRCEHFWPEKEGEWYTVKRGTPRFPGHDMPRIPLLGCQDEADPNVMRQHIELAMAHGVNVFIVDWYWYQNQPCFERQLNEGLIPAIEGTDCKFFLMWANHDVNTLWNMHEDTYWDGKAKELWTARTPRHTLEPMFERIVDTYFSHPNYYRINDNPVLSLFDTGTFIAGLDGIDKARDAVSWMRTCCKDKGYRDIDIQAIARLKAGGTEAGARLKQNVLNEAARTLGFSSATSYQFCMDASGTGDYVIWTDKAMSRWPDFEEAYGVYYPHVSIGWDNTQRNPSFGAECVVTNATPDAFEACLWKARAWLDARPEQAPLVTINSWNEWTEGSYLLPDMRWGYRYLQAVRNVFGSRNP